MSVVGHARRLPREQRVPRDAYHTSYPDALACVRRLVALGWLDPGAHVVAEPHAGGGAFVAALDAAGVPAAAMRVSDVRPDAPGLRLAARLGATGAPTWVGPCERVSWAADWTVGNPPYTELEATIQRCLRRSRVGCAFLLEAAWMFRSPRRMGALPAPVGVFRWRSGRRRFEVPTESMLGRRWLPHPRRAASEHALVVWMHERPAGAPAGQWHGGWV